MPTNAATITEEYHFKSTGIGIIIFLTLGLPAIWVERAGGRTCCKKSAVPNLVIHNRVTSVSCHSFNFSDNFSIRWFLNLLVSPVRHFLLRLCINNRYLCSSGLLYSHIRHFTDFKLTLPCQLPNTMSAQTDLDIYVLTYSSSG